jgi:cell division protein ZapA (FtsZ GTPase activity inhibitor)
MSEQVTVKITINGTVYPVTCIKGEENRLIEASDEVNKVIEGLSSVSGMVGETRLLAMSSLILADKLLDNKIYATQITEFINWFSKTTERMNKVAKLLENK